METVGFIIGNSLDGSVFSGDLVLDTSYLLVYFCLEQMDKLTQEEQPHHCTILCPTSPQRAVNPVIFIIFRLQVWALSISVSPPVLHHRGNAAESAPTDQGLLLLGYSQSEWHRTWSRGTDSNCVYLQGATSDFTYETVTDATCLLAGRQTEAMPTGAHGGTQLPRQQHLKRQRCWSHTSHQTEEDRSPTPQKIFTWARSNRAWKTFDTESHDWRVGGQRKSTLSSHWFSTWLRHMNVLHIVWTSPLSSALENNSYLVLLNCSELIMPSYQKQRNKWCTFLCIHSAKYHQTDVGVEMLFVRCTSWLCCPSNAR